MKYKLADVKRCPFCGSLPVLPKKAGCLGYVMSCRGGRSCQVYLYGYTREDLIKRWNERRC